MMTNIQIDAKVTSIEMLEAQIAELKAVVDSYKAELKAELDEKKVDVIDTGLNKIWYKAYEKTSVDTKALKADGLYEKYSSEQTVIMFKMTKSKLFKGEAITP